MTSADRTIGQLVADTLRWYGDHVWVSFALGIGPAALTVAAALLPNDQRAVTFAVGWPVIMTFSFVTACFLVSGASVTAERMATATAVGLLVSIPVPILIMLVVLPAVLWLGLLGLAVPAAVKEGAGVRDSIRRGLALGRTDFIHAAGTVATLVLLVVLTQLTLYQLLHGLSDQAAAVAAFLASTVITPILFIGSAMLYDDQRARERARSAVESPKSRTKEA
jgi:hypothetical protein